MKKYDLKTGDKVVFRSASRSDGGLLRKIAAEYGNCPGINKDMWKTFDGKTEFTVRDATSPLTFLVEGNPWIWSPAWILKHIPAGGQPVVDDSPVPLVFEKASDFEKCLASKGAEMGVLEHPEVGCIVFFDTTVLDRLEGSGIEVADEIMHQDWGFTNLDSRLVTGKGTCGSRATRLESYHVSIERAGKFDELASQIKQAREALDKKTKQARLHLF